MLSLKKISICWRNSGLSAILVPVLLSLFCERRRKKEGRGERAREEGERRIQSKRLSECQLFSEAAAKSKCLPAFLLGWREGLVRTRTGWGEVLKEKRRRVRVV